MSRNRNVNIDRDKLRKYLTVHNISYADLSREIGANAGYISKILGASKNQMSIIAYNAMCTALNVPKETFLIQDAEPTPTADETQLDRIEKKLDKLLSKLGVM